MKVVNFYLSYAQLFKLLQLVIYIHLDASGKGPSLIYYYGGASIRPRTTLLVNSLNVIWNYEQVVF